jgi:hypothetical protein
LVLLAMQKAMKRFLFIPLTFAVALTGTRAAPFQNLDFESATFVPIPNDPHDRVYLSSALPYWTGYIGADQTNAVLHNNFFLGSSGISIQGPTNSYFPILEGSLTPMLQAGTDRLGNPTPVALSQTGLVPLDARSLFFRARASTFGGPNPFVVTLDGETLSMMPIAVSGDLYTLYGGDVSAYAGQTLELRFTALPFTSAGYNFFLDAIEFSPNPVPEPSTFALLAIAGAFGWFYWRRKRR